MDPIEVRDWTRGEIRALHMEIKETMEEDEQNRPNAGSNATCVLVLTNWQRELILAALEKAEEL